MFEWISGSAWVLFCLIVIYLLVEILDFTKKCLWQQKELTNKIDEVTSALYDIRNNQN